MPTSFFAPIFGDVPFVGECQELWGIEHNSYTFVEAKMNQLKFLEFVLPI